MLLSPLHHLQSHLQTASPCSQPTRLSCFGTWATCWIKVLLQFGWRYLSSLILFSGPLWAIKKINKNATTTATARHRVKDVYKKNLKVEVSLSPETSPRSISCQRCMCSQSMGVNNCCQGLQTTVCNKTTHFQWRGFSCYRGSHKGFREQNLLSL